MPVPASISGQITPSGAQPYANAQNYGQLLGEVSLYATHAGIPIVQNLVNNAVRQYYDRRLWYGLMTKGQIVTPGYYATGTVTLTLGSPIVQGNNTNWTASLGGQSITKQQLRVGFIAPIYNIIGFNQSLQQLTLELPWGLPSMASTGYFITQYYYSIPNIKYIYSMKNLQLMYRLWTNMPQAFIENVDPARLQILYPRLAATMPPDKDGNYQIELWPSPNTQQALPYLAYVQPSNLVNDSDNLPPYIRADIVKAKAIADVLLYRPKANPNYSEATCVTIAQEKLKEFERELQWAEQMDENLWRQNVVMFAEQFPYIDPYTGAIPGGAFLAAMTPASSDDY